MSVIEPGPWWPRIGMPLMAAMSTAVPVECSLTLPDVVMRPWPHSSELTVGFRPLAARNSSVARTRRAPAAPRAAAPPRRDAPPAAVVDLDVRAAQDPLRQRLLAHEQDLADGRVPGVRAVERVLARGAVDRRGFEQLPAVEDRLP